MMMICVCVSYNPSGKRIEKKLDGNYARMQPAILTKPRKQHPTKQQLYGHLPPIWKTIQVRWTRHVGYYWRSTDKLQSDILLWTPSYKAIDDRDGWKERIGQIRPDLMMMMMMKLFLLNRDNYLKLYFWKMNK